MGDRTLEMISQAQQGDAAALAGCCGSIIPSCTSI